MHHMNFDPGIGFCYSRATYGADCPYRGVETRINTHGPMLYLGLSGGLIRTPLEWTLRGTWMFTDVADDAVFKEGEHFQIDCGLSYLLKDVEVKIGYDGPVECEPFDRELREMDDGPAMRKTKDALDRVWALIDA